MMCGVEKILKTQGRREPVVPDWDEVAGYFDRGADQLYHVLHRPKRTFRGSVLLAGPFAAMRRYVYTPWVQWARFLAAAGYEVLRFDYRGVGESSGEFSRMGFSDWLEDVRYCADWLRQRRDNAPLVLHGLHLGALLSCRAFREGQGDALLLWSAPTDGSEMLHHAIKMYRASRFRLLRLGACPPEEDHAERLEAGHETVVDGYPWSPRLWQEAPGFQLQPPEDGRPWLAAELDASAGPLQLSMRAAPRRDVGLPLNPDLSLLFAKTLCQIENMVAKNGVGYAASASN